MLLILCAPVWLTSLAFEPDLRAAAASAQPLGVIQGRRAAHKVPVQLGELHLELRILGGPLVLAGQLVQGKRQGLRDVPAAEPAKAAGRVGNLPER